MKSRKRSLLLGTLLSLALLWAAPLFALSVAEITDITPKVDENPVPVRTTTPEYPKQLKADSVNGIVTVVVVVDESGSVLACEVAKSTHAGFNDSAIEAVKKWKFKPAVLAGKPVKVRVTIPVRFSV